MATEQTEQQQAKAVSLVKRYDRLDDAFRLWAPLIKELADYIVPRRGAIIVTKQHTPGRRLTEKLFDSTAPHACDMLAASLAGTLTSASDRWFSLKMREGELNDILEISDWLYQVSERIYLALNQSNFNSESHELYVDLAAFGTGDLYLQESDIKHPGFNGFQFAAAPIGSFYISEDDYGQVNTVARRIEMPVSAMAKKWGLENLSEQAQAAHGRDMDQMLVLIHMVMPREQDDKTSVMNRMPWCSYYVEYERKWILSKGYFHEFPHMVPRWTKAAGEVYGRSPGNIALPDIKTLNKAVELKLGALAKALNPPLMQKDDGVIGRVSSAPAALNTVRDMDAIKPMMDGARFDVAEIEEDKLRQAIRTIFFSDQLQLQTGPQMTATEVEVRFELMQRLLGPTMGRLESEFLNPLIDRCFALMMRAGALPPVPPVLAQLVRAGKADMDVSYEGPLARAQRGGALMSIQRAYAILGSIAQAQPEVMDVPDPTKISRFVLKNAGVPDQLSRSQNDINTLREGRAKDAMVASQQQQQMVQGEMASKIAPLVKGAQQ